MGKKLITRFYDFLQIQSMLFKVIFYERHVIGFFCLLNF